MRKSSAPRCWWTRARASSSSGCRRIYKQLRREVPATLVFIEASEEALLRRFSETRRPHPLGHDRPVREGLRRERELMAPIRKLADVVIDTTKFNVHELRQFIVRRFQSREQAAADGFAGELRLSLRRSRRRRPGVRRALFAQSAFHSAAAQIFGTGRPRSRATSVRFRRPGNFCGASRACSPI